MLKFLHQFKFILLKLLLLLLYFLKFI